MLGRSSVSVTEKAYLPKSVTRTAEDGHVIDGIGPGQHPGGRHEIRFVEGR